MEDNPFSDLRIDAQAFLDAMDGRILCPKCGKSRKYFCYTCYVPVQGIEDRIPKVKLPFKVDIIKHPSECDGKSTSAHAGVIAPDDVTIYTYPCIPDFPEPDRVVVLFPGHGALTMEQLAERLSQPRHPGEGQDDSDTNSNSNTCDRTKVTVCPGCGKPRSEVDNSRREKQICSRSLSADDSHIETHQSSTSMEKVPNPSSGTQDLTMDEPNVSDKAGMMEGRTDISQTENQRNEQSMNMRRKRVVSGDAVMCDCGSDGTRSAGLSTDDGSVARSRGPFDRAIFIDSTWNQTRTISSDERLKGLTRVELKTRQSHFWRHQKDIPTTYLSTIEAIYYFVRDYHDLYVTSGDTEYDGRYDNLLFFFSYTYSKIKNLYSGQGRTLMAYTQREERAKSESTENKT